MFTCSSKAGWILLRICEFLALPIDVGDHISVIKVWEAVASLSLEHSVRLLQ